MQRLCLGSPERMLLPCQQAHKALGQAAGRAIGGVIFRKARRRIQISAVEAAVLARQALFIKIIDVAQYYALGKPEIHVTADQSSKAEHADGGKAIAERSAVGRKSAILVKIMSIKAQILLGTALVTLAALGIIGVALVANEDPE